MRIEAKEGKVVACFLTEGTQTEEGTEYPCIGVPADGAAPAVAPKWKAPAPDAQSMKPSLPVPTESYEVRAKGKSVEVCPKGAKTCKTVKLGFTHPKGVGHGGSEVDTPIVAVTEDGKKLFVIAAERVKGAPDVDTASVRAYGETWDVDTGKRLARVPLMNAGNAKPHVLTDYSDIWQAAWLGDRILLSGRRCCGPAGGVELLDPSTGDAVMLGDPIFFVRVKGDRFLLGAERHEAPSQLTLLDVKTAKVVATFDLPSRMLDEPELYAMDAVARPDGKTLVVYANPPGTIVIDATAGTASAPRPLPSCP